MKRAEQARECKAFNMLGTFLGEQEIIPRMSICYWRIDRTR